MLREKGKRFPVPCSCLWYVKEQEVKGRGKCILLKAVGSLVGVQKNLYDLTARMLLALRSRSYANVSSSKRDPHAGARPYRCAAACKTRLPNKRYSGVSIALICLKVPEDLSKDGCAYDERCLLLKTKKARQKDKCRRNNCR